MRASEWELATDVLRLSAQLVEGIQAGIERRGFADVRPAHGFTFTLLARGPATTSAVALHLGVTKQAASQLVDHLVEHGYVERRPDPQDRRQKHLVLTDRGRACTAAAQEAAAETVREWQDASSATDLTAMRAALAAIVRPGPLRPAW